jgi:hypothetical protein
MANVDIKYINKDYTDLKASLIEYAKAYFPQSYNDFTSASPGTMFIEMAAYVGDVLSFYLDNQIQETFLQYAKQTTNLYALAYMLGYRPKATSAATVELDIYQLIPSIQDGDGNYVPDYSYALIIHEGMQVSAGNSNAFYVPEPINFAISSSYSPTEVSVYSTTGGLPDFFLLKKSVQALSGTVKTTSFNFSQAEKFKKVSILDTNIIQILDVVDSDGNKWYEVPYLAQDTVLEAVANLEGITPNYQNDSNQVPYFLQVKKVSRRFVSRVKPEGVVDIEFGSGINSVADEAVLPNPNKVAIGVMDSLTKLTTAYDPTNFTSTYTYGLAPSNTTLTFTYLVGGGASANVAANSIGNIIDFSADFFEGVVANTDLGTAVLNSISINNPSPASGGGDGDTLDEIKLNTLLQYPTQLRAVTSQDYIAHVYNMPSKFGKIAKAAILKDSIVLNSTVNQPGVLDPYSATIYILATDSNGNLTTTSDILKQNLKTYLSEYRMLTDTILLRDAFIVNIGVNFEVVLRPNYAGREVIARCIEQLQAHFNLDNWQINQPIILSDIYTILDKVTGVQTVRKVEIVNKYGEENGYSKYAYDISAGTLNGVIYPSLDPSIFEVKYPDVDIKGKVVTF